MYQSIQNNENLKYPLVSIDIMNAQVNLRLPESMLVSAKKYAKKHGFSSLQDFIKETLREKLFERQDITKKELRLVKNLLLVSEEKGLYSTEKELFKRLKKR
jgi:Arc/MetJ-type ribon-helix-helix transcriptional regulator